MVNDTSLELNLDSKKVYEAYNFASDMYAGVFKKTGKPYFQHLIEVALIIQEYYSGNDDLIAASLLHDCIEDSLDVNHEIILERFGKKVADIVQELTDNVSDLDGLETHDKKQVKKFRKLESLKVISNEAKIVFLADKISNARYKITKTNKTIKWKTNYASFLKEICSLLEEQKFESPLISLLKTEIQTFNAL